LTESLKKYKKKEKIPVGDFPEVEKYRQKLVDKTFSNFPKYSERLMNVMEEVLTRELPMLMNMISPVKIREPLNPFDMQDWIIQPSDKQVYDNIFRTLGLESGKLSGSKAKQVLMDTGIPKQNLRQIWELCDMEKDGALDSDEFALSMYLCELVKKGKQIPEELPSEYIPPSKRHLFN